ncbi:MAG TPA: class I SAM-dependent methyltransferase [Candidatus Wallbacteria bacterium]|nr:class I SAM-dependent methyltransferase [Candidatus Wallbacteria bacterium]
MRLHELYDDRYGYAGKFPLMICHECGHKWLDAKFSNEELAELYTNYYPRSSFKLEQYKPHVEASGFMAWLDGKDCFAFKWVPPGVRILDIGCGFGEMLGYHKARGCDVYGVEADSNILRVAEKFGFNVKVGLFDPKNYERDFFDYVTMDQVIEHMADPVETLRGIARILKPGGTAVLSAPNSNGWGAKIFGKRWINWHAPYHLQHFSMRSMKLSAETAGLTLAKARTITCSEWLHYQWVHLFVRPDIGKPAAFWSEKGRCGIAGKIALRLLPWVRAIKLNHLITRGFDAAGIGDNYVFILRKEK